MGWAYHVAKIDGFPRRKLLAHRRIPAAQQKIHRYVSKVRRRIFILGIHGTAVAQRHALPAESPRRRTDTNHLNNEFAPVFGASALIEAGSAVHARRVKVKARHCENAVRQVGLHLRQFLLGLTPSPMGPVSSPGPHTGH